MATVESITVSKTVRRRVLGLSLHGWENAMAISLGIAAFAAAIVGVSTWAVIQLTRESNHDLSLQIAEANARSAEAQLALEKFRKPRTLPVWKMSDWEAILKPFEGTPFRIWLMDDTEQLLLASRLRQAFGWGGWMQLPALGNSFGGFDLMPEYDGIDIRIDASREAEWLSAARAIAGIFHAEGIDAEARVMESGTPSDAIQIFIGRKK